MLAIAERRARPKSEPFYRPFRLRVGLISLHHFPALRTGLSAAKKKEESSRLDRKFGLFYPLGSRITG
jgi:hypothetical protein